MFYRFQAGLYSLQAVISNPFGRTFYQQPMAIGSPVRGIGLLLPSQFIQVNVPTSLIVKFEAVSDSVCICVDHGDGNKHLFLPVDNSIVCLNCSPAIESHTRPFRGRLTANLLYRSAGKYTIRVTAGRPQDVPLMKQIGVVAESTTLHCPPPTVEFVEKALSRLHDPLRILSTDHFIFNCRVIATPTECVPEPHYVWQIWRYNTLSASDIKRVIEEDTKDRLSFLIRAKSLPPDSYRIAVLLRRINSMNVSVNVQLTEGFLHIEPAPLIIRLIEMPMSSLTVLRDHQGELCLHPEAHSVNPNGEVGCSPWCLRIKLSCECMRILF